MDHYSALVFLLLPCLVLSSQFKAQDGPCPSTSSVLQVSHHMLKGKWFGIASNYETQLDPLYEKKCYELTADFKEGTIEIEEHYKTYYGAEVKQKRYSPIEDQPGKYLIYKPNNIGEWETHGWVYNIAAVDDEALLEYACRELDSKHISFYRILSKDMSISEEAANKLKSVVKENGDERELMNYKHNDC